MEKPFKLEELLKPGFIDHLIETSVWQARPLSERPVIELERWQVMQLPNGDRHFVGWNMTDGEGRASSSIVDFDPVTCCGRTAALRIYVLNGRTAADPDGAHCWRRWMRISGVADCTNVSDEVQALIDAPQARRQSGGPSE